MKLFYSVLLLLLPVVSIAQITWQPIGPFGGNVTRVAADSNGALFAMADNGVYRSIDNGTSWVRSADVPVGVTFVAFAIARNGTYFASTANAGAYRSTDQGLSWTQVREGLPQSFAWSLAANPVADEVLVATGPGIYRTTDNGTTWTLTGNERIARPILFAPDGTAYAAIDSGVMRSSDPARATWTWTDSTATPTAITGMILVGADTLWAGSDGNGVWRSVDGGVTWTARSTGLTSMDVEAIDHGYAGELYVSTADGGLHRSTDDGELWVRVNPSRVQFVASSVLRAPTDRLFASSPKGLFYTDAHAIDEPWTPSRTGFLNAVPRSVIVAPDGELYVLQFTGVFHRAAGPSEPWTIDDLDIPPGSDATGLVLDSTGALIASVKGVGLYRSTDRGATWERYAQSLPILTPTAIAVGPFGRLYVGSDVGVVYRSTDQGATWEDDTLATGRSSRINAIAVRDESVFVGSELNVFVSRDGGRSYEASAQSIRTYSLAVAPNGYVVAGSFQGRVYRSIDDGMTWTYATTTPTAPLVAAVGINARGDVIAGVQPGGIYLSRDSGATYVRRSDGLVNPAITAITFDAAGRAYVGTYGGGVHVSEESTMAVRGEVSSEGIALSLAPSPASSRAAVTLGIPRSAYVRLDLFDASGERARRLHDGDLGAGTHRFAIDAAELSPGVYRIRALVDGASADCSFIIVR